MRKMGARQSSLNQGFVAEPATGQQYICGAAICTMTTCAFDLTFADCIKSGCTQSSLCFCIRIEQQVSSQCTSAERRADWSVCLRTQACVCSGDSETCVLCQGGASLTSKPPVLNGGPLCKSTSRICFFGNRCAFPCDNDVPCACAILFIKCFEAYPHPCRIDIRACAKTHQVCSLHLPLRACLLTPQPAVTDG